MPCSFPFSCSSKHPLGRREHRLQRCNSDDQPTTMIVAQIPSTCFSFSSSFASATARRHLHHQMNNACVKLMSGDLPFAKIWDANARNGSTKYCMMRKAKASVQGDVVVKDSASIEDNGDIGVVSIHHVGLLCEDLERSLEFYQDILGLEINEARPHDKLPYRGAWLWVGSEMIHLMELPNPDPLTGRPEHGGRDRHACIAIRDVSKLKEKFDKAGISYTLSKSGRPAIFARDPDANALEFTQV